MAECWNPVNKTSRSVSEMACPNFARFSIPYPRPQIPCPFAGLSPGINYRLFSRQQHIQLWWRTRSPSLESYPTSRERFMVVFQEREKQRFSIYCVFNNKIIKIYEYSCSKKIIKLSVRKDKQLLAWHLAGRPQWTPESSFKPAALLLPVQQHCPVQYGGCQGALYLGFLG